MGPDDAVPHPDDATEIVMPNAVVLPGLINLHTHLELHAFRGKIADGDFFEWIQQVRRVKEASRMEDFLDAARAGLAEAWRFGTTTVADTGNSGATAVALSEMGGRGIFYQEAFGPHPEQADTAMTDLRERATRLATEASPTVRIGLSPHAPYTVSAVLFSKIAEFARAEGLPIAIHIAESQAESSFVTRGSGKFADSWRARGIPLNDPCPSPVAYMERLGVLGPDVLAIHAVQVNENDIAALEHRNSAVALCPRSNERHGHGTPPVRAYANSRIRVGFGTDSAASVDSLDLFEEARAAMKLGDLTPHNVIAMLTLQGARAIGMEGELGSLEAGKWADLCVLKLGVNDLLDERRAAKRILTTQPEDILSTYIAGRLVYEADESNP